ncbi:TRAP transporter substrate-binding protein [Phreatobacter stygius]|uniref:TRAP transporter substrate-binding protein n=1 Tax=Phreatobacter stygius TaxID=1940610 RepID=A0A4D7B6U5_9HYPH|nr:TRAP transporter substrate-binding protein [Phreatobacter stygius]QCI66010.1 TRAP transporter substrate-binding protein [Phreatobacter stygius]
MRHQGTSSFTRRGVLGTLATGAAIIAAPATLRAQRLQWIGATGTPAADFIGVALDFFAKRVAELTKDQIVISSHHGGSLGGEREHVEALLQGAVHVATPGQGVLAGWYRPAEVWTHPYLFKDVAHKDRVWDTIRAEYQADTASQAKLRPLGAIPRMPRQLTCNRPVRAPADMKGLKIRVPETALWRRTFEMFGASPTPLPFPEVFQALKSGVIDGQENPIALTFNSGIFDANTHLSLTEHMMQDNCILVGEVAYQRLTPDQRAALDRAARDVEAELRPKVIADDTAVMEQVKAKRIMITEVDKAAFAASVRNLVTEFPAGKKWVERIGQVT